jgi:hypothetical protein
VEHPREWPWSSPKTHLKRRDDRLVTVAPLLAMVGDWRVFLRSAMLEEEVRELREHERTGRSPGQFGVLGSFGEIRWSYVEAAETRPQAKDSQPASKKGRTFDIMSPEYNRYYVPGTPKTS